MQNHQIYVKKVTKSKFNTVAIYFQDQISACLFQENYQGTEKNTVVIYGTQCSFVPGQEFSDNVKNIVADSPENLRNYAVKEPKIKKTKKPKANKKLVATPKNNKQNFSEEDIKADPKENKSRQITLSLDDLNECIEKTTKICDIIDEMVTIMKTYQSKL